MTKLIKKSMMAGLFGLSLSAGVAINATAATAAEEEAGAEQCWTYNPEGCPQCCDDCDEKCMGKGYVCCMNSVE